MDRESWNPSASGQSTESDRQERRLQPTLLERLRRSPQKSLLVGFALQIATLAWHGAEKVHEHSVLTTAGQRLDEEGQQLEMIGEKMERIKTLFGPNTPKFYNDYVDRQAEIAGERQTVDAARQKFSAFDGYDSRAVKRFRTNQSPDEASAGEELSGTVVEPIIGRHRGNRDEQVRCSEGTMREIVAGTFPRGWVGGEVSSVTQSDSLETSMRAYGLDDGWELIALCTTTSDGQSRVVFSRVAKTRTLEQLVLHMLPHEFGHANDWDHDADMTMDQRADLLLDIVDRLDDDDRLASDYVEAISRPDPQAELARKAAEYWAEICAAYFDLPGGMAARDYAIVDRVVRRSDPQFDLEAANERRMNLLSEAEPVPTPL